MNNCPCCSQPMLRYVRKNGVYWFCSHCWQEMPDLEALITAHKQKQQLASKREMRELTKLP